MNSFCLSVLVLILAIHTSGFKYGHVGNNFGRFNKLHGYEPFILYQDYFHRAFPSLRSDTAPGANIYETANKYPFLVLIKKKSKVLCIGSIYTSNLVITSASCVKGVQERGIEIVTQFGNEQQKKSVKLKKITRFEKYLMNLPYHDIALLKLSSNLPFTDFLRPVTILSEGPSTLQGSVVAVVHIETEDKNEVLLDSEVPVVDAAGCKSEFPSLNITDTTACAKFPALAKYCKGKYSGVLLQRDPENNGFLLAGLISGESKCGSSGQILLSNYLPTYSSWIMSGGVKGNKNLGVDPKTKGGSPANESRIIGGTTVTDRKKYPFLVMLRRKEVHICSCSIIKDTWVLTASHCFETGYDAATYDIVGGVLEKKDISKAMTRKVKKIILHENYNKPIKYDNDIALIQVESPISFGDSVQIVKLSRNKDEIQDGQLAYVAGWGATDSKVRHIASEILMEVQLEVIDTSRCREESGYLDKQLSDNMFCAGNLDDSDQDKDTCQGDSGGPLLVFIKDLKEFRQIGIVSWGRGCAAKGYPGVYTRLHNYIDWIEKKTGTLVLA